MATYTGFLANYQYEQTAYTSLFTAINGPYTSEILAYTNTWDYYIGPWTFIDPSPDTATYTGYLVTNFYEDLYGRVYILPNSFDYNLVISEINDPFEIWVADLDLGRTLSTVTETNTNGTSINLPSLPAALGPNSSIILTLTTTLDGPAVIDALYEFDFTVQQENLTVTGQTLIIWDKEPRSKFLEDFEWNTSDVESRNGKNTYSALWGKPRRSFSYSYHYLTEEERDNAYNAIATTQHYKYAIPEWTNYTAITQNITAMSSVVYFDLTVMPLSTEYYLLLLDSTKSEAIQIDTIEADHITIKYPIINAFDSSNTIVMPLLISHVNQQIDFLSAPKNLTELDLKFEIIDAPEYLEGDLVDTYGGIDVLMPKAQFRSTRHKFQSLSYAEKIDFNLSQFKVLKKLDHSKLKFEFNKWLKSKTEIDYYKEWFYKMKGKQGIVYIPFRTNSIRVYQDVLFDDTFIHIEPINIKRLFDLSMYGLHIIIEAVNGDTYFRQVTNVIDNTTYETLTITALGTGYSKEDLQVSRLVPCNIAHNKISLDYNRIRQCNLKLEFQEVFQ